MKAVDVTEAGNSETTAQFIASDLVRFFASLTSSQYLDGRFRGERGRERQKAVESQLSAKFNSHGADLRRQAVLRAQIERTW
jgi:hypothetical protein